MRFRHATFEVVNANFFRGAALFGLLAVALGAFGAHALKATLISNGTAEIWNKAVLYHLVHAVVLLALALSGTQNRGAFVCFLLGIVIFSGSLYLLALTNLRWLGAITPFGGLCLLAGWAWLIISPGR
jgi:uncharacterized membrane protein YgdD (TMEM256/DUF423 family)